MLLLLYFCLEICYCASLAASQTCSPLRETNSSNNTHYIDKRLDQYQISHLLGLSLRNCVTECILVKMCKSFNYRLTLGICELNSVNLDDVDAGSQLQDEAEFEYYDIRRWPSEFTQGCATRPCAENQRCLPTTPHICVDIDCGPLPVYTLTDDLLNIDMAPEPSATTLGSTTTYWCEDRNRRFTTTWQFYDLIPFYNRHILLCSSNSIWSFGSRPSCTSYIDDCSRIKMCSPYYGDGSYWIYTRDDLAGRIVVYCSDMASAPKTYVTLPSDDNISVNSGFNNTNDLTRTVFSKVRIDREFAVDPTDFTFATTTGPGQPVAFGSAGSCGAMVDGEKAYGYFKINTEGTRLRVTSFYDFGCTPSSALESHHANKYWTELNGTCWSATCGSCQMTGIRLLYDAASLNSDVDGSDIVMPTGCPFAG